MNDVQWLQFVGKFPDLAASSGSQRLVRESAIVRHVPAKEILYRDGDECAYLPMMLSGSLSLAKHAETGRSIVLYRVETGESCILSTLSILRDQAFPAEATTEEAATVVLVPAAAVRTLIQTDAVWRDFAFAVYHDRLSDLIALVEEVVFTRLDVRTAEHLLRHAADGVVLRTHQELAAELGSSREVVSRLLKEWERRDILSIKRGRITILDRQFLEKATGEGD